MSPGGQSGAQRESVEEQNWKRRTTVRSEDHDGGTLPLTYGEFRVSDRPGDVPDIGKGEGGGT